MFSVLNGAWLQLSRVWKVVEAENGQGKGALTITGRYRCPLWHHLLYLVTFWKNSASRTVKTWVCLILEELIDILETILLSNTETEFCIILHHKKNSQMSNKFVFPRDTLVHFVKPHAASVTPLQAPLGTFVCFILTHQPPLIIWKRRQSTGMN